MVSLGFLLTWAGYGLSSYGYILVKGWNITMRQWFSPLNPYQWPASGAAPPFVPKGKTMPTGTAAPVQTDAARSSSSSSRASSGPPTLV